MIYFTADTHFNHHHVIRYDKRPWKTIDEMQEALICIWNTIVRKGDTVYHLGDFAFKNNWVPILEKLNGNKHLILGNHDTPNRESVKKFITTSHIKRISYEKQKIVLCHYPMYTWQGKEKGAWHLYGHCHGNSKYNLKNTLEVGCMLHGYRPISFDEVKMLIARSNKKM